MDSRPSRLLNPLGAFSRDPGVMEEDYPTIEMYKHFVTYSTVSYFKETMS
jgi:hypothetical protein